MLKIESIQNGIVIDHIPAGKGMDIYKLLPPCSAKNVKECNQMQKSPLHYQYGSKLRAHLQIVLQWKI